MSTDMTVDDADADRVFGVLQRREAKTGEPLRWQDVQRAVQSIDRDTLTAAWDGWLASGRVVDVGGTPTRFTTNANAATTAITKLDAGVPTAPAPAPRQTPPPTGSSPSRKVEGIRNWWAEQQREAANAEEQRRIDRNVQAIREKARAEVDLDAHNRLDDDLRREARSVAASMVKFRELIDTAKAHDLHTHLGFASWTAYVADVIAKDMNVVAVDDRRQVVALMASEGMSQRAIAEAVGVSQKTVDRDLDQVSHDDSPERVTGRDGKSHPAQKPPKPKPPTPPAPTASPVRDVEPDCAACTRCGDVYPTVQMYPDEDSAGTITGYICEDCEDDDQGDAGGEFEIDPPLVDTEDTNHTLDEGSHDNPSLSLHTRLRSIADAFVRFIDQFESEDGAVLIILERAEVDDLVDALRTASNIIEETSVA